MPDIQWFETWFNTPYYHLLYNNRNECEAEDFITTLLKYLHPDTMAKILDVGCGKGRHSHYLAKLGYETTGIDLAAHSIEEAKKEPMPNLNFEVWDMRKVYKPSYFDIVVNLFSSFGYFDQESDDMAAIQAMADDLKPRWHTGDGLYESGVHSQNNESTRHHRPGGGAVSYQKETGERFYQKRNRVYSQWRKPPL